VALVLAALGLYGVMTYVVRQRTTEIGLRIALGARPSEVVRYVTRQGMRWTLVGLGLGLAASFALTRLLSSLLYGIGAADAVSFIGMAALLLASSYTACYVPGRRASRMDPLQALRHD
jgi:ABC-type antimicrobial peptide transport system permease subunit